MRVLIVNDDGIHARGLKILANTFHAARHDVLVVAPERECSAFSHHITFQKPLMVKNAGWEAMEAWWIDGTPSDCAKFGLLSLDGPTPELVISGINEGCNLGTDVHYSGTVAAAMEAAFMDKPAIAVSAPHHAEEEVFQLAADEALAVAERLHQNPLPAHTVLNLNVPRCAPEAVQGRVAAPLAFIPYEFTMEERKHPFGFPYYWSMFSPKRNQHAGDNDVTWNERGYITYTVLGWDLTLQEETRGFLPEG